MLTLPEREKTDRVNILLALGSEQTEAQIRALLQRHDWDIDAAAIAIFDPPPVEEGSSMSDNVQLNVNNNWTSDGSWAETTAPSWNVDIDSTPALRHNTPAPDAEVDEFSKYMRGRSKERVDNGALNSRLGSTKRTSLLSYISSLT